MDSATIWSFVVTIIGLIGFRLSGKKVWWAWYVNIANQILWAVFAITTEQWGFLIGIPFYLYVFGKNAYEWTRDRNKKPNYEEYVMAIRTGVLSPNEARRLRGKE